MARIESSVTSVSWIPLDAMEGVQGLVADLGVGRWDLPPPDQLENLDELIAADAIRFANELRAWIEVEDGVITGYGHLGKGRMGQSIPKAGSRQIAFAAVALPDLRPDPKSTSHQSASYRPPGDEPGCRCLDASIAGRSCNSPRPRPGRRWP